jgi:hypothetical protein
MLPIVQSPAGIDAVDDYYGGHHVAGEGEHAEFTNGDLRARVARSRRVGNTGNRRSK